jgi:electron transfer flavoprotein beta subunit
MRRLDIIVCIKPVPDPKRWNKLKLDPETMLLQRSAIPAVINALDRNAIEQALVMKALHGGTISVVTMAPPDAEDQLAEALAMGCDRAFLLSDPAFAGADTLATARALAAAIRKIGAFDIIFCGAYSADGSTSQVGPQVAELLAIPDLTHAVSLEAHDGGVKARCQAGDGRVVYECDLPLLVTVDREANTPRLPTMPGILKAGQAGVTRWTAADLGVSPAEVGLKGSPTQMLNVFTPPVGRKGEILKGSPNEVAGQLVEKLRAERLVR